MFATRRCGCGVGPVVSVRCGEDAEYVERSIEERGVIRRRQIMVKSNRADVAWCATCWARRFGRDESE